VAGEFYGVMTKVGESGMGQWHEGGRRREQGWEQKGGRRGGLVGSKGGSGQLRAAGNGRMQGEQVRIVVGGKGGKVQLQQGRPVSVRVQDRQARATVGGYSGQRGRQAMRV
jgi:hypothetical protein